MLMEIDSNNTCLFSCRYIKYIEWKTSRKNGAYKLNQIQCAYVRIQ